jgi:RHS repeat-associated protein
MPRRITSGTAVTDLEYDALQTRVVKRGPTATTYYAGDLYRSVVPASGGPRQHRYAVFAGGRQLAELARTGDSTTTDVFSLHDDALGSLPAATSGSSIFRQDFAVFGEPESSLEADTGITAGFTGHEHDRDLGLYNMQGRVYDPLLGRFLTADPFMQAPFASQGLNRYSYVFNTPASLVDPSGFIASTRT